MMSMVVQAPDKQVYVFSKGAETSILPLISDKESDMYKQTIADVENFGECGMRTLVFSYKKIDPRISMETLKFEEHSYFESDMTLLGATGVEDMLQDDVKKCIIDF